MSPDRRQKKSAGSPARPRRRGRGEGSPAAPPNPLHSIPFDLFPSEPTELVFGLVGALGTDWERIIQLLSERLKRYGYSPEVIRISQDVIPHLGGAVRDESKFHRASHLIDLGNRIRSESGSNAILALAAAATIKERRPDPKKEVQKRAYIVSSLKHFDEVAALRTIYSRGFYLFGIHTSRNRRLELLRETGKGMTKEETEELVRRDEHEEFSHGQQTRDTFHLADFFLADESNDDELRHSIWRCLDLVFGSPTVTPTFSEFAMFMAFAASLRSGDLSRQVGAVVARDNEILSTGANDAPCPCGGQYWPELRDNRIQDVKDGRDLERGYDSNSREKGKIAQSVAAKLHLSDSKMRQALDASRLADITEYGRSVHAEMAALIACARGGVRTQGARLYCTTFPCHNCAKHIVAAGICEVVFVQPYEKSQAATLHSDAITMDADESGRVRFKPFIGVGPRQFFDLFSMSMGAGRELKRKDSDGNLVKWSEGDAHPRVQMVPLSYREFEDSMAVHVDEVLGDSGVGREVGGG